MSMGLSYLQMIIASNPVWQYLKMGNVGQSLVFFLFFRYKIME